MKTLNEDILLQTRGIILQGVNTCGVMNSGLAKLIRDKYPKVYNDYINQYNRSLLKLGTVSYVHVGEELFIANCATQSNYGRNKDIVYVNYDAVRKCFKDVFGFAKMVELPIHLPKIGCGLANGDWSIVEKILHEEIADSIEKILYIY